MDSDGLRLGIFVAAAMTKMLTEWDHIYCKLGIGGAKGDRESTTSAVVLSLSFMGIWRPIRVYIYIYNKPFLPQRVHGLLVGTMEFESSDPLGEKWGKSASEIYVKDEFFNGSQPRIESKIR